MATGLPARKELTPEQKEEVQKRIDATKTYLNILQLPHFRQNTGQSLSRFQEDQPTFKDQMDERENQRVLKRLHIDDPRRIKPPPKPDPLFVPPVANGSGSPKIIKMQEEENHWLWRYTIPYILLGIAGAIIMKLLAG